MFNGIIFNRGLITGISKRAKCINIFVKSDLRLKNKDIGIFITDHNVRETLTITDRSYLLYSGKILKSGTTQQLINDEEAKKLYLGTKFKME